MKLRLNRREFLSLTFAGCGTLLLPRLAWGALPRLIATEEADPHFFLHIYLFGGADQSYLFDARPLAMTAAGKIQNFLGEEPSRFTGVNGQSCWQTSRVKPLERFRSRFSVLNGVVMAQGFDGHDQNLNFLLAGNPFGGESFLPHLNQFSTRLPVLPLDGIQNFSLLNSYSNENNTVTLSPEAVGPLKGMLDALPDLGGGELGAYLQGRYEAIGAGPGRFSAGAATMARAIQGVPDLKRRLAHLTVPNPTDSQEKQFVSYLAGIFRGGVGRSAAFTIFQDLDTHAPLQTKKQPETFEKIGKKLGRIFAALAETPFDDRRSLFDVTTVMVSTEFGRTMRIQGSPIDDTGTNHNALTNTILLAGKGIKGGQVIGASDFQSATETLSPIHQKLDMYGEKTMGRPFDFARMAPSDAMPEVFDPAHYLTSHSVVNTIYNLFNVPVAHHRTLDRSGTLAPVLRGILS